MSIFRREIEVVAPAGDGYFGIGIGGLIVAVSASLCVIPYACADGPIVLRNVTEETGIAFKHTDGSSGRLYIMETVSAGLALFDYDLDGDTDIYFLNGAPLRGMKSVVAPTNALYRNEGDWRFTDVTREAGVGDTGYGLGVAVGDYDNDRDPDIYLNNYGLNLLYRNNGDGTFTDVTEKAGVGNGFQVGAGASFLDMDKDGDLDLYVSNYVEFSYEKHVSSATGGYSVYASPVFFPSAPDTLYRNNGDGTFTDVSKASGVAAHAGRGMGIISADYDNDGDTDVFTANDVGKNFLLENDGMGRFEEVGLFTGVAYDLHGDAQGSMGVDCGDYDNDGLLDFYVTSYQGQLATLYKNLGDGVFEDATLTTGARGVTLPNVTWGTGFVDIDNDGDRDIFIACGHLMDNVELYDDTTTYRQRNVLLMNTGDGKFLDVSERSGDGMKVKLSSRGAGFDDLDNDGDIDVVIQNSRSGPTILSNDTPSRGHWLQVRLRGVKTNRDGIGAHVRVTAGDLTLLDEVHSGRGYQSHYGMRLHFGLGGRDRIDRIEVRWVGGGVDVFEDIAVDQSVTLTEGSSKTDRR
ncbi:MAG: CRTAC1 family protein [Phycisphaerales bacterium]|nr:MAG: CRTAC1 family protein [Phycisphaerales bacterium]